VKVARRRQRYHRGNVREDLLAEAHRVLANDSLEGLTVRGLTAAIGVTPANFYNHFASLDALLAVLARDGMVDLSGRVARIERRARGPGKVIREVAKAYVRFADEQPQLYRLMFGHLVVRLRSFPEFADAAEAGFANLVRLVYGDDRYDRADPMGSHARCPHAYAFFSLLNGLARDVIDGLVTLPTARDRDAFTEVIVGSFIAGDAYRELGKRFSAS